MSLELANWHDILTILHETRDIWSSGLSTHDYHDYIWLQLNHQWGKRNYRYYVYKERGEVVSSCKLYNLIMTSRGKQYRVRGLGAIYTRRQFRGQNFAKSLVEEVIEVCALEDVDAIVLFSDIGPDLYQSFGFVELGSANFSVSLKQKLCLPSAPPRTPDAGAQAPRGLTTAERTPAKGQTELIKTQALSHSHVPWLARHYLRWLRYQPFGVYRCDDYWHYKISKENFLHANSQLSWPALEITKLELDSDSQGYAITEVGGGTLRILEVVGSEQARMLLWQSLFERAFASGYQRIRGWESVIRDFEPNYKLIKLVPVIDGCEQMAGELLYTERDWGRCMFQPLNPDTEDWLNVNPCPLLELDHL
jgi:GNAT superfamily N-acetyltransferase